MKISLIFVEIITEQISIVLIIPKSLRRIALTIANAPRTLCADSCVALTSFAFPIEEVDEDCGVLVAGRRSTSPLAFLIAIFGRRFDKKVGESLLFCREMPNFAKFVKEETLSGIVVRAFLSWRTGYGGAIFLFIFHSV
ncbi:MAG: hypothetical protein ACOCNQ_00220 [Bacteroidales bacterium]